ncbi:MAG: VWA domain-containing protein [Oscillospiraceae bacterium]|nr:VWA domain-containing protein [Oscillospiraceae bacterium]
MMVRTHSLSKRLLATILTVVMVFSMIPNLGVSAQSDANPSTGIIEAVTDASTLDSWKLAFDPENITTQHAGGVWTDKSVLNAADASSKLNVSIGKDNFLVALSALAANSIIVGQGTTPTDTVFVLDISGSLSTTELDAMVVAANDAIHTLLTSNEDNRVGIVLYSTNAHTLLELDRYTPVTKNGDTVYIERTSGTIRTARVTTGEGWNRTTTYIKDGQGNEVNTSVELRGGTYIQGGLWEAYGLFQAATVSDTRTPVMVLMSDGAPTYTTNNYSDVPDDSNYGAGNRSTAGDGFVTGLTASYVKNQIAEKYQNKAYLYTLGLGVDNVTDSDVAKAVLDPIDSKHSGIEDLWDDFEALANAWNKSMTVNLGNSPDDPSISYMAGLEEVYVNKYFSASEASDLSAEFKKIVNEISLNAGYYVTRLDGENANLGGYITFVDEIGSGMQIKDMKGILIGNQLFTGEKMVTALLNQEFGTATEPTTLGDNMVWALKQRLGIADTATIHQLIQNAYDAGQIGMTTDAGGNMTSFSNYVGWFSDANGDCIGFWNAEDPNAEIPANAAYANKCYLMMGATTDSQTSHASDMMYLTIQVSKAVTGGKVLDKTPEQVSFRIPAGLLPTVTYQIELDTDNVDTATKATVTYKAAQPIRLLYEVGVHEKLNALNIHEFIRENYQAKDENGNYYLYTNAWRWENADNDWTKHPVKGDAVLEDTSKNSITYAYFEPGEDNEHYYFTHDEQIYVKNGDTYTAVTSASQLAAGNTYYYKHHTYTNSGSGINTHYDELSAEALQIAIGAGLTYVPKGTMHFYGHSHDRDKAPNTTGSYFGIRHHLVNAKIDGSSAADNAYELVYMGNNGRITYAPAQGISISKSMADGTTPDAVFTFDVTLTAPAGVTLAAEYDTVLVAADGTETSGKISVSGGKAVATVKPGQTLHIIGLPTGTTYTVTERRSDGYLQSDATGITGSVAANHMSAVSFVNRVRGVGSLNVVKAVEYLNGAVKTDAAASKKFPVTVTVTDGDVLYTGKVYVDGTETDVTDGVISFEIVDGQTVTITNLPEAYTYTVVEGALPAGYAYVGGTGLTGTITTGVSNAVLNNSYTPEEVKINEVAPFVTITASKNMESSHSVDFTFQFQLLQFNGQEWTEVTIGGNKVIADLHVTAAGTSSVELDLSGLTFTKAGTYDFRVIEVIPAVQEPGMTYDRTFHDFEIVVADIDLDGKLEISKVEAVGQHTVVTPGADNYGVTAGFTNTYALNSTKLTIQAKKILTDITAGGSKNMTLKDGQFTFVLTDTTDVANPVVLGTEGNGVLGDVLFPTITYTNEGTYTYTVHEVNEGKAGYTYDGAVYSITVTVGKNGDDLVITDIDVLKDNVDTGYVFDAATFNNILNGDTLAFNNTYKADPTTLNLTGNKTLTNLTPGVANTDMTSSIKANDYTFALSMQDGTMHKIASLTAEKGYYEYDESQRSAYDGGVIAFNNLYFNEAGTYVFELVEKKGSKPGVTYDAAEYLITVVVTDNGEGKLEVTSTTYTKDGIPASKIEFNNTYKAEASAPVTITGSKELTGIRDIVDGEFSFTLTGNGVNETVKNVGKTFTFSELTFDTVGTYTYTVSEVNGGQTINGVTYDDTVYTVTVTVTDDGTGKLTASVSGGENIAFENDYVAAPAKIALTGRKLLAGRPSTKPLGDGEFSFVLTGDKVAGGSETKSNAANGTISFSEIEFDTVGTYTFTIKEVIPTNKAPGIHYDETTINVTVVVKDNGLGQLVATVTMDPRQDVADVDFRFFNRYHADDTDPVVLEGTKELLNRPAQYPLEDNEFSFILKDKDGKVVETVKNVGNKFTFTGLTFDAAGEYAYTIEEENGGATIEGVTYSAIKYDVTVTVTDEGTGKLTASVEYKLNGSTVEAENVKFVNTYAVNDTETLELSGKKDLQDRPAEYPLKENEFSFTITGPNLPAEGETVTNDINGDFKFSKLNFTAVGEYVYTVTEVHKGETINGVKYDDAVYTVTVNVTDNGEGGLDSTITYEKNGSTVGKDDVIFTNTYDAADTDPVILEANKELTGRPSQFPMQDNEFQFTLTGPNIPNGSETKGNVGGKVTFTGITFDKVGKYEYTITEVAGGLDYIDYDETEYKVIVEVKDLGTGKLTTQVTYTKNGTPVDADKVLFTNAYQPKATDEVELGGNKNLVNITGGGSIAMTPGNEYSFNLKGNGVDETVTNNGSSFAFSKLTFDKAGDHVFTITEVKGSKDYIGYDDAEYQVTITVTDEGTGKLKVTDIAYTKDGAKADKVVFDNTYNAKPVTGVVIEANKTLTDITGGGKLTLTPANDDFSFNLKGAGVDETVKNVGGKVTFTLDYNKPGKYEYTMTEVVGNKPGIGYDDKTAYNVVVTVTDPGDGQLVASVAYKKGDAAVAAEDVVFANTFKAADAELTLAGKKTLSGGRDLKPGEFSFTLKGENVNETVANDKEGIFKFNTLTFDKVGTYSFTISEVNGGKTIDGVHHDEKVYEITVTVSYDGKEMTAVATVDGKEVDEYGFTNIFTPDPVTVEITAEKKVDNKSTLPMGKDGFTFQLTDGQTPATKVSGTDGLAKFQLTYTGKDVGKTYTYKLSEVKGSIDGMTYDEKVYEITVTISQDATTGELKATVSKTDNAVFTNVYAPVIPDDPEPPKTADNFDLARWATMLTFSAFCMMAVLVLGKKKQEQ